MFYIWYCIAFVGVFSLGVLFANFIGNKSHQIESLSTPMLKKYEKILRKKGRLEQANCIVKILKDREEGFVSLTDKRFDTFLRRVF